MLAALNPLGVVPSALFFAAVATEAETMSRQTGVPVFLGDVIQGTSLICMLTALLFTSYRLACIGRRRSERAAISEILDQILQVGFFAAVIRVATPLLLATLGELFSERGGVLNLGIEGIMLLGAMVGFTTAYTGELWLGIAVTRPPASALGW